MCFERGTAGPRIPTPVHLGIECSVVGAARGPGHRAREASAVKQDEQAGRIRGRERFGRAQRVRSPRDFQRVRRQGRSVSGQLMTLGYALREQRDAPTRAGFSASKRVGGAVVRNRLKRRLREALRRLLPALASGWDLVLTARVAAAEASYEALAGEVHALLTRAGLWNAASVAPSQPMREHGDFRADERGGI